MILKLLLRVASFNNKNPKLLFFYLLKVDTFFSKTVKKYNILNIKSTPKEIFIQ